MATFNHDGETLWFDTLGRGAPLVVLHGGLGLDHTYLRPAFDTLGEDVEVVYVDLRANGRSSGDGTGMTMTQLAGDVEALRRHLGHDRIALLGHSYGGFVALEYALHHPGALTHLVLCDTDASAPAEPTIVHGVQRLGLDPAVLAALARPITGLADLLEVFDAVEPAYLPHSAPGTARAAMGRTIYRPEGAAGGDAALTGWDATGRLGDVAVPTLVVTGADDFMFPPERARRLAEGIPGAQLEVVAGSGHLPHAERPVELFGLIRDFLTRPGQGG